MTAVSVLYNASKTGSEFHQNPAFVKAIMGPVGSGKSVTCVQEMLLKVLQQKAHPVKGVMTRRSRWLVVRNTYRELLDTTIKTFFDWIPQELGTWVKQDMTFYLKMKLSDGSVVDAEFLFRALDRPNDAKKLLSLELTGIFVNECREIPKAVIDLAQTRLNRYPAKKDGGSSWSGMILDTNPPDTDSWFYRLFEELRPDGHAIYYQPSGLAPDAENVENLADGYYTRISQGKDKEWVNVYVHGKYGFVSDGVPVYPEYVDELHFTDKEVKPIADATIYVGIDFGLTPAAVFIQEQHGTFYVLEEVVTFDMGAVNFAKVLKLRLAKYRAYSVELWGDPAGDQRAQTDEDTPFRVLDKQGISAFPTFTNDPVIRREVVAGLLSELYNGKPRLQVTSKSPTLRKGFNGGYKYKRLQVVGDERCIDKPCKNKYSHVHDALQYAMLGAVGDDGVVGTYSNKEIDYSKQARGIV